MIYIYIYIYTCVYLCVPRLHAALPDYWANPQKDRDRLIDEAYFAIQKRWSQGKGKGKGKGKGNAGKGKGVKGHQGKGMVIPPRVFDA